jgi:hypothetical protein
MAPESLAMYRAVVAHIYSKVEKWMSELDLKDKPARLWNYQKTGLTYIMKSGNIAI